MNHSLEKSKKEYWEEQITKFHLSGKSRKEYCLAEKLTYSVFSYWLKKSEIIQDEKLVKIPSQSSHQINTLQSFIEIIVADKISIRIPKNFDGELLHNIINELGIQL